jgi:hypothetical protein
LKKKGIWKKKKKEETGIIERAVKPYSASLALLVESCGQWKSRAHVYSLDTPALETNNFRTVTERVRELFRLKFIFPRSAIELLAVVWCPLTWDAQGRRCRVHPPSPRFKRIPKFVFVAIEGKIWSLVSV